MDVYRYLKMIFDEGMVEEEHTREFALKCLNSLLEEAKKLDEGPTIIGSTEVLESVFGKYEAINEGLHGITGTIFGICTFVEGEKNVQEVKESMENCSVLNAIKFVKQKFGQITSKTIFSGFKATKFDNCFRGQATA